MYILCLLDTLSEEILASQQPNQLVVVKKNKTCDFQQVKEELVDIRIIPPRNDDSPAAGKDTNSEPMTQTDCQLFPNSSNINVTTNNEWNPIDAVFMEHKQAPTDRKACRFCGLEFDREADLIRHMDESHMGEKAFKCSECDKAFARRDHFIVHLRIHTGERPHKCSFCRKSFAQRSNLNVHLRTHTGEKPYFCRSCGKRVAHSYHLKTCRLSLAKRDKLHHCFVCDKNFCTASDLQLHKNIHKANNLHPVV